MIDYTQVKLQPCKSHKFKLLDDLKYKDVVVPNGYKTNGADIPRLFWIIYPPNRSDFLPAVIIHDYLCDNEEYEKADEYFAANLRELGIGRVTIFVMVSAVRVYHFLRYNTRRTK